MKASILIMMFFLFGLATSIELGVDISLGSNKPVLDEEGNQINPKHKCLLRVHELEPKDGRLFVVYTGTPPDTPNLLMQIQHEEFLGEPIMFHSKAAVNLNEAAILNLNKNENLTVYTSYGFSFAGSAKFWKLDSGSNNITQSDSSLSDSGEFMMEEIVGTGLKYEVYKLLYHPGEKEVGMSPYHDDFVYAMVLEKSDTAFSFHQCQQP